jgi:hypothetical protein
MVRKVEVVIARQQGSISVVVGQSTSSVAVRLQVDVTSESEGSSRTAPEGCHMKDRVSDNCGRLTVIVGDCNYEQVNKSGNQSKSRLFISHYPYMLQYTDKTVPVSYFCPPMESRVLSTRG